MAAASAPSAVTRPRNPGSSGSRRRAYLVAALLAAGAVLLPVYVTLVLPAGSGADVADAAAGGSLGGATDRITRITFRRTGGTLGLRLLRDAPAASTRIRGRRLALACGYRGESGLALLERTLSWPAGRRTAHLPVPQRALATMQFCSLGDRGRIVARVVFR